MESVRCARAMGRGIGQGIDDLQLLDDRAGPSVRDDERQRVFMFRTHVNEMNVQPIDLGDELRQGVQFRLDLAPVVLGRPIAREFLNRRELHALRLIRDRFPFRPLGRVDAPAEVGEGLIRHLGTEGADCGGGLSWLHGGLLSGSGLAVARGREQGQAEGSRGRDGGKYVAPGG